MIVILKNGGRKHLLMASQVERADEGAGMVAIFTVSGAQILVSDSIDTVMSVLNSGTGTLNEFTHGI